MIATKFEYEKAESELRDLQTRLERLQTEHPIGEKGFTKAELESGFGKLQGWSTGEP